MTEFDIDRSARVQGRFSLIIDEPPSRVWAVLADLERWPDWNPAITRLRLDGPVKAGTTFRWTAGGAPIRSRLEVVRRGETIGWTGTSPGIRARHVWHLHDHGDGTELVTEESFTGLLPALFPARMTRTLMAALRQGARDLQHRVELGSYRAA